MAALELKDHENGVERWETPDLSVVEYRAPDGQQLRFEAFTSSSWWGKKKIGAKITTKKSKFKLAQIDSVYFLRIQAEVYTTRTDRDHDTNDSYLDEYESTLPGPFGGPFPSAVRSMCCAQWHGANFIHPVRKGPTNLFTANPVPDLPTTVPDEWPRPTGRP
jgi:hypothetical protein